MKIPQYPFGRSQFLTIALITVITANGVALGRAAPAVESTVGSAINGHSLDVSGSRHVSGKVFNPSLDSNKIPRKGLSPTTDWHAASENSLAEITSTQQNNLASTTTTSLSSTATVAPTACENNIDAIGKLRNEIFVFKRRYFWRFDEQGYLVEMPIELDRFWYGLPDNLNHIDAVFEDTKADVIYFFSGRQFWEFSGNYAPADFPKSISNFGFPKHLKRIDAAFQWGFNDKIFFFAGDKYWALDPATNRTELDYPRPIANGWKGVPNDLDAVFTAHDGYTYFVKGKNIYRYDDRLSQVQPGWPQLFNSFWTECGQEHSEFGALKLREAKSHLVQLLSKPVANHSPLSAVYQCNTLSSRCLINLLLIYAGSLLFN